MLTVETEIKPSFELFQKAIKEFHELGKVETIHCNKCNSLIQISPLGTSAWKVSCECGLYNDSLRGI